MRDIAHKAGPRILIFLERLSHHVEGLCELPDLPAVAHLDALVKIALGELARRLVHLIQRPGNLP